MTHEDLKYILESAFKWMEERYRLSDLIVLIHENTQLQELDPEGYVKENLKLREVSSFHESNMATMERRILATIEAAK